MAEVKTIILEKDRQTHQQPPRQSTSTLVKHNTLPSKVGRTIRNGGYHMRVHQSVLITSVYLMQLQVI